MAPLRGRVPHRPGPGPARGDRRGGRGRRGRPHEHRVDVRQRIRLRTLGGGGGRPVARLLRDGHDRRPGGPPRAPSPGERGSLPPLLADPRPLALAELGVGRDRMEGDPPRRGRPGDRGGARSPAHRDPIVLVGRVLHPGRDRARGRPDGDGAPRGRSHPGPGSPPGERHLRGHVARGGPLRHPRPRVPAAPLELGARDRAAPGRRPEPLGAGEESPDHGGLQRRRRLHARDRRAALPADALGLGRPGQR